MARRVRINEIGCSAGSGRPLLIFDLLYQLTLVSTRGQSASLSSDTDWHNVLWRSLVSLLNPFFHSCLKKHSSSYFLIKDSWPYHTLFRHLSSFDWIVFLIFGYECCLTFHLYFFDGCRFWVCCTTSSSSVKLIGVYRKRLVADS